MTDLDRQELTQNEGGWNLTWLGPGMFYLSFCFLVLLAAVLVLWIDVPRAIETSAMQSDDADFVVASELSSAEVAYEERAYRWGQYLLVVLLVLWPAFLAEQLFYFIGATPRNSFPRKYPFWWLYCILPPLRLCARDRAAGQQIWLPHLGWQVVDRKLRKKLERLFSVPMVWIALLILPVLGLQFYFKERIEDYPTLRFALHFGTGLIWFAFAVEFIVMVSVAEKKLAYCKKHWLDLAIVLLPLISFLRTLRILRATKLVKLGKLQQITRVVRVYRVRGVAMRALRAVLLLEIIHRLLRTTPENRIKALEHQYLEKQHELEELKEEIRRLKACVAADGQTQSA